MDQSPMNVRVGLIGRDQSAEAARIVCASLPLNCTFFEHYDYDYGNYENGVVTGMVGAVYRGELDTAQPIFTPTYSRWSVIEFSNAYFYVDVVIATRSPIQSSESINFNVVTALRWETWCVFLASLVITSAFIILFSNKLLKQLEPNSERLGLHWLLGIFQHWPSLVTHKHHEKFLMLQFARQTIAVYSLAIMVLASAYTSALFSDRMKRSTTLPYKDFESMVECLEAGKCRMVTNTPTASYMQVVLTSDSSLGKRILATFAERNIILTNTSAEIPQMMLEDQNTYLVWITAKTTFEEAALNNSDCRFYVIRGFSEEIWAFPLRKKSPLLNLLNFGAAAFAERGMGQGTALKYASAGTYCTPNARMPSKTGLGASTTAAAFLFLGIGVGCGIVAFVVETQTRRFAPAVPNRFAWT